MFKNSIKLRSWLLLCTLIFVGQQALAVDGSQPPLASDTSSVTIMINGQSIEVEYASTFAQRSVGLMHRKKMCQQCGMLFKFANPKMASMWMKNTFIPLDVAFINSAGVITDIKALQPHDLTSVGSSEKVLFALEMHQGWFKQQNIAVGDTIQLNPH